MFAELKHALDRAIPPAWRQQWQGLSSREQTLVKQLIWVLVVALLYFVVWSPISEGLNQAERKYQQAQKDWNWLNQQAQKVQQQGNGIAQVSLTTQSRLSAYVQKELRVQKIFPQMTRITPINKRTSSGIELYFATVSATDFTRWLSKMEKEGLRAERLEMTPKQTGLIEAKVYFEVMS